MFQNYSDAVHDKKATDEHEFCAATHAPQPKVVDDRGHKEGADDGAWAPEEKQEHRLTAH